MDKKVVLRNAVTNVRNAATRAPQIAATGAQRINETMVQSLDQNGDGVIDIQDIIIGALKLKGIKINRSEFLTRELKNKLTPEKLAIAVTKSPIDAGMDIAVIDKIADEVIQYERNCVSGISAALGAPGGTAMLATVPVDIIQYYGYTLRAVQKLLYLYGFPEIDVDGDEVTLDSETINEITLCLGVMYGVAGANHAIMGMAKALATGVEKKLINAALTKGAIYPFIKSVMKWFGINLNKKIFAGFFGKSIPLVGSAISGGITYASFKPCCMKLKDALKDTMLSNPNHVSSKEEDKVYNDIVSGKIIDVESEVAED